MRQPKLPSYDIRDYVMQDIADSRARNVVSNSNDQTSHTTLAVGNTQTVLAEHLGRVKSVQLSSSVAAVSAYTVQLQVNDRDIFEDALRPSIAAGATLSAKVDVIPTDRYIRGETIDTIIEVVDAAQTGTLTVLLETEPYELVKRDEVVPPTAKQRFERKGQRDSYSVRPQPRPVTVRQFGSFQEATSGVAAAKRTTADGDQEGVPNKVGTGTNPVPIPRPAPRLI